MILIVLLAFVALLMAPSLLMASLHVAYCPSGVVRPEFTDEGRVQ